MTTKEETKLKKEVDKLEFDKKKLSLRLSNEKAKRSASAFKREVKKSLLTAFVAAFGFLIALEWREVISVYIDSVSSLSPVQGNLINAFFVTIIGALGILAATHFLGNE